MELEVIVNKGRNKSSSCHLNYFARKGNVYIMDNHLAAIWCWEKLSRSNPYTLIHIDAHYDLGCSPIGDFIYGDIDLNSFDVDSITSFRNEDHAFASPFFLWDNYIYLFDEKYPGAIKEMISITQQEGSSTPPDRIELIEHNIWDLDRPVWYGNETDKILNLDIDYFFKSNGRESFQLFSDETISFFSNWLVKHKDVFEQITIALSPECCGSWENAVTMANKLLKPLDIHLDI